MHSCKHTAYTLAPKLQGRITYQHNGSACTQLVCGNYLKVVVQYVNRCLLKAQLKDVIGLLAGAFLLEYSHSSVIALAAEKA